MLNRKAIFTVYKYDIYSLAVLCSVKVHNMDVMEMDKAAQ